MARRRWYLAAALGLCVLGIPAIFRGDITEIIKTPNSPTLVGKSVGYAIVADNSAGLYTFEWRCFDTPPGSWSTPEIQEWPFFSKIHSRVGTFDLRFGALEGIDEDTFWSFETQQETISGPDQDVVAMGVDVDSTAGEVEVRFAVLSGASQIGGVIDGKPQEKLIVHNHIDSMVYSTAWVDPEAEKYYWDEPSQKIVDVKHIDTSSSGFQNAPVDMILLDIYHRNRMVIKHCSGADQAFEFAVHHFQQVKTGADTWKLVEVDD